ncbi:MAG: hypothetical protein OEQ29_08895 [Alphaproteobacteria bacterium]|nr:hypothetical protein [Alphaproteobacteria bacterium]
MQWIKRHSFELWFAFMGILALAIILFFAVLFVSALSQLTFEDIGRAAGRVASGFEETAPPE